MSVLGIRQVGMDNIGKSKACVLRIPIDPLLGLVAGISYQNSPKNSHIELPSISATQTEISRERDVKLNTGLATFIKSEASVDSFFKNMADHKLEYNEFSKKQTASRKLVNYSFNMSNMMRNEVKKKARADEINEHLRDMQINSSSPFFSEYENDIRQDVSATVDQMVEAEKWLRQKNSKKILVPELNMSMQDDNEFAGKLEQMAGKYDRIDLYDAGLSQVSLRNWLKFFIHKKHAKKNTWFHMNGIWNRHRKINEPDHQYRTTYRIALPVLGISSTSLRARAKSETNGRGKGQQDDEKKLYRFGASRQYEEIPYNSQLTDEENEDRVWVESFNNEIKELGVMRESMIQGDLYTRYLPNIPVISSYIAKL